MKLPYILAVCDYCHESAPEISCYPPEEVAWSPERQQWLCSECFVNDDRYEPGEAGIDEKPVVFAEDALLNNEGQQKLLIAAAARKRLGVKT